MPSYDMKSRADNCREYVQKAETIGRGGRVRKGMGQGNPGGETAGIEEMAAVESIPGANY